MEEQFLKDRVLNSRYRLIKKLGEGGMSIVYLGEDLELSRKVAVKILKFQFLSDEKLVEGFKTEAKAVAKLSHENIVKVYDVGVDGNINFIIMELLESLTLKDYIKSINDKNEYMKNRDIVHIALQIALGLQNAHDNGIIHKDIKPQNIIISEGLKVKVTDFGIAQFTDQSTKIKLDREAGSVHYSSPEQLKCQVIDKRTDIYSFGILLYELSTGKLPYNGDADVQVALQHLEANFVSPSILNSRLNSVIEKIINFATMRSPRDRFQNMTDIIELLDILYLKPNQEFDFTLQYPELQEIGTAKDDDDDVKIFDVQRFSSKSQNRGFEHNDAPDKKVNAENRNEDYNNIVNDIKIPPINAQDNYQANKDQDDAEQRYDNKLKQPANPNIEYIYRSRTEDEDEIEDEENSAISTFIKLGVMVLIGIIIGLIVLLFIFLPQLKEAQNDQPFTLENVEGMNFTQAGDKLMKQGLMINKVKTEASDTIEPNSIISQSPEEGTTVKRGQTINVIVSSGKSPIIMPNLKQNTLKEAQIKLENNKMSNVVIVEEFNLLPKGMVVSHTPEANTEVYSDTRVELVVSKGPENPKLFMPNLIGRTKDEAIAMLKEVGLQSGTISTSNHPVEKEGNVIDQKIIAGTEINEGTTIDFTISLGPELDEHGNPKTPPTTEPDLPELPEIPSTPSEPNGSEVQTKTFYVPLGIENTEYNVKVTMMNDGTETAIYEQVHKKEEQMVEINIKGSGSMTLRFYIDNVMVKETLENFE